MDGILIHHVVMVATDHWAGGGGSVLEWRHQTTEGQVSAFALWVGVDAVE